MNYYLKKRVMLGRNTIAWDVVTDEGKSKTLSARQVIEDSKSKKVHDTVYCLYNDGLRGKGTKVKNLPSRQVDSIYEAIKYAVPFKVVPKEYRPRKDSKNPEKITMRVGKHDITIRGEKAGFISHEQMRETVNYLNKLL